MCNDGEEQFRGFVLIICVFFGGGRGINPGTN